MKSARMLILATIALLTFVFFQNCSKSSQDLKFTDQASKSAASGDGNHYDGKIFLLIGELCPDGSRVQGKIQLSDESSALLLRDKCADISPVPLSSADFQLVPLKTNELVYKNQTYYSDLIGAGYGVSPKLTTTLDPTAYGAKGDGITDNTAAFTAALAAGDILIPAGTYMIGGTIRVPPGRNIQCASLSSVKLVNSVTSTKANHATFQFWGQGGSVSNCYMSGTEVFNPNGTPTFDVSTQYNALITVVDYWGGQVGNVKIINNILENCHGNSCVTFYGGTTSVESNQLTYNTIRNCGYHAVVVTGGKNNLVSQNRITDCSVAVQNDNLTQVNLNNIFEGNYLSVTHGNARGVPYITGGSSGSLAANYSSNIIRNNTVVGNGSTGSINILTRAPIPAQYIGNHCQNGCNIEQ